MLAYHAMYKSQNEKGSAKATSGYNLYFKMKKKDIKLN